MEWKTIDSAPQGGKEMFVVRAFNVDPTGSGVQRYTTDPYCVWNIDGAFHRWPHAFQPTHWTTLPEAPKD